ncbi:MAG: B12-binding domain-containing radical SAM protein [Deltaproteobacteria bacterium]|nr:B12-binding domain-containing radical SAM protein [Deltaproteobacteria bacterium]
MSAIVFIDAPTTPEERIGKLSGIVNLSRDRPHIGILILAAIARENGWKTSVIDPYPFQWSDDEIVAKVRPLKPDIIAISAHTLGIINADRLAALLKDVLPGTPVIIGGPHVTSVPFETLLEFHNFDVAVIGEAEDTLMELLDTLITKPTDENLGKVKGIAFRSASQKIVVNPRRPFKEDLDSLPMPAWDLLPEYPLRYSPSLATGSGTRLTGSLFTSRGCPWKCEFCDRGVFGSKYRTFSPKYIMRQILHLYHNYGVREIMFSDDVIFADKKRITDLARMLIEAKLDLRWECMARVIDADEKMYQLIRKSGCFEISYGIESAPDTVSKLISKPIKQDDVDKAIRITQRAGIRARGYFIFGLPGHTKETLELTSRYIMNSGLDDVAIFTCTPYPGSDLYSSAEKYGVFKRRFNRMNNIETIFVPYGLTEEYIESLRESTMRAFYLNSGFILKWTLRYIRENSWKELFRRSRMYTNFHKAILSEMVSGFGRGA